MSIASNFLLAGSILTLCFVFYMFYQNRLIFKNKSSKNKVHQKKRNEQRQKRTYYMIGLLLVALLFQTGLFFLVFAQMNNVNQKMVKVEKVTKGFNQETNSVASKNTIKKSSNTLRDYKEQEWKWDAFGWEDIIKNAAVTISTYETQLSAQLKSFIGENSVAISKSSVSETMTVSVFSTELSFGNYQVAAKNITNMVTDIEKIPAISIIDFSLTYVDEKNATQKQTTTYYRENDKLKLMETSTEEDET